MLSTTRDTRDICNLACISLVSIQCVEIADQHALLRQFQMPPDAVDQASLLKSLTSVKDLSCSAVQTMSTGCACYL